MSAWYNGEIWRCYREGRAMPLNHPVCAGAVWCGCVIPSEVVWEAKVIKTSEPQFMGGEGGTVPGRWGVFRW